jgi:hypothetical protein
MDLGTNWTRRTTREAIEDGRKPTKEEGLHGLEGCPLQAAPPAIFKKVVFSIECWGRRDSIHFPLRSLELIAQRDD